MKNYVGFVIFVAGAAIGSVATWYYVKDKYARIAQEEIDSVKERFSAAKPDIHKEKVAPKEAAIVAREKPSVAEYAKKLSAQGYTNYSNSEEKEEVNTKPEVTDTPFVISPDEFGELEDEGYDKMNFTYYADGVLADEEDEIVDDIEGTVGPDSLNHFGDYEDDSVHVRNNRLKVDYEILLSQREYSEILEEKPYLRRYDE